MRLRADLKFCMQCPKGFVDPGDKKRVCSTCRLVSCLSCMPEGQRNCAHCKQTRVDCPEYIGDLL